MSGDIYWSNVACLLGFEDAQATDVGYSELSPLAQALDFRENAPGYVPSPKKYGTGAYYFDSGTAAFSVPHHADFFTGTESFTIEFWAYWKFGSSLVTTLERVMGHGDLGGVTAWHLCLGTNPTTEVLETITMEVNTTGAGTTYDAVAVTATGLTAAAETWHHIAVDFDGTKYRVYLNGTMVGSSTTVRTIGAATSRMWFGHPYQTGGTNNYATGSGRDMVIDDIRITSGVARYANDAGFTAPAAELPVGVSDSNWANVTFRMTCNTPFTIVNEATSAGSAFLLLNGAEGVSVSSAQSKFGTQSLKLVGREAGGLRSGSAIAFTDHATFHIGAQDFTVEGWFRFNAYAVTPSEFPEIMLAGQLDTFLEDDGWTWFITSNGTSIYFNFVVANAGTYTYLGNNIDVSASLTASTWHHLACDFDGTKYRFYLNGVMVDSVTAAHTIPDTPTPLTIGNQSSANYAVDGYTSDFFYTGANSDMDGYVDEFRLTVGVARYATDTSFTTPTTAFGRGEYQPEVNEGIGIFAALSDVGGIYAVTSSNGVGVNQSQVWAWSTPASDDIGMTYQSLVSKAVAALATDTISTSEALSTIRGIVLLEQLRIAHTQVPNHNFQLTSSQGIGVSSQLVPALPVTLSETIATSLVQQAQLSLQVIEELGLAPVITPMLLYGWGVSETVRVASTLAKFLGADTSETIGITHSQVSNAAFANAVSETIGVAPTLNPQLILRVIAADTIDLDVDTALNMLFAPTISEGIELSAAYLSPGSSVTTWAINTRTAAVSEYSNYDFNSFARMGNKYLGASSSGLYELLGDDDAGTSIISEIKSGFAQWAGTRFTMFKGIYIATRGAGNFVLRLTTGDGRTYNYSFASKDMETARIHTGKGLRARYFAFELISTGQDFDLDTLEFVPLVAERRV